MSLITHRDAAVILEQALGAVFDETIVRQLREDSALAALGMTPADAVCLSDAVAEAAARVGWVVDLGDADVAGVTRIADLVNAIAANAVRAGGS